MITSWLNKTRRQSVNLDPRPWSDEDVRAFATARHGVTLVLRRRNSTEAQLTAALQRVADAVPLPLTDPRMCDFFRETLALRAQMEKADA